MGLLRQHRLRQREEALALGVPLADDALLFTRGEGKRWRPDVCTNRFDRLRATLGLEHVRLHDYADVRVMPTSTHVVLVA